MFDIYLMDDGAGEGLSEISFGHLNFPRGLFWLIILLFTQNLVWRRGVYGRYAQPTILRTVSSDLRLRFLKAGGKRIGETLGKISID